MNDRIRGSFPGGPGRRENLPERDGPPRLERVEGIERRTAERSRRAARRARTKRLAVGLVVAMAVAGIAGYVLGLQSHATATDIVAEQDAARAPRPSGLASELSSEVNRTLLELWRMEDVEAQRNSGRIR